MLNVLGKANSSAVRMNKKAGERKDGYKGPGEQVYHQGVFDILFTLKDDPNRCQG